MLKLIVIIESGTVTVYCRNRVCVYQFEYHARNETPHMQWEAVKQADNCFENVLIVVSSNRNQIQIKTHEYHWILWARIGCNNRSVECVDPLSAHYGLCMRHIELILSADWMFKSVGPFKLDGFLNTFKSAIVFITWDNFIHKMCAVKSKCYLK